LTRSIGNSMALVNPTGIVKAGERTSRPAQRIVQTPFWPSSIR